MTAGGGAPAEDATVPRSRVFRSRQLWLIRDGVVPRFLVATASTTGKVIRFVLLALGLGLMDCMLPSACSLCLGIGGRYSGAVRGAMKTADSAGGFACTRMVGRLLGAYGDYSTPVFLIAGMGSVTLSSMPATPTA